MPEELEKHLVLNSNRLRTFEFARLEIVTYVEAKFGLRIRDSKPSDTGGFPINLKRGALPWLMLTGTLPARRCTRASKEKIGKKCMTPTRQ